MSLFKVFVDFYTSDEMRLLGFFFPPVSRSWHFGRNSSFSCFIKPSEKKRKMPTVTPPLHHAWRESISLCFKHGLKSSAERIFAEVIELWLFFCFLWWSFHILQLQFSLICTLFVVPIWILLLLFLANRTWKATFA